MPIQAYGLVNYLCTVGIWNGIPESGPKGEMALSTPKVHARPFHFLSPAQCTEDFKGWDFEPRDKTVLRWVQLFRYPETVAKQAADDWYVNRFSKQDYQSCFLLERPDFDWLKSDHCFL